MLCFRKVPIARKFIDKRRGLGGRSIKVFRREDFVSYCQNFGEEFFGVWLNSGIEKVYE